MRSLLKLRRSGPKPCRLGLIARGARSREEPERINVWRNSTSSSRAPYVKKLGRWARECPQKDSRAIVTDVKSGEPTVECVELENNSLREFDIFATFIGSNTGELYTLVDAACARSVTGRRWVKECLRHLTRAGFQGVQPTKSEKLVSNLAPGFA